MIYECFLLSFCLLPLTHFTPHFPFEHVAALHLSILIICCCLLLRLGLQGKRGGVAGEGQKGAGGLACTPEWADGEEQGQQQVCSSALTLAVIDYRILARRKTLFSSWDRFCIGRFWLLGVEIIQSMFQKHLVAAPSHRYCSHKAASVSLFLCWHSNAGVS